MRKLFKRIFCGSRYVYFIENKHTHEWVCKEEVLNIDNIKVGTTTNDPLRAHAYSNKKSAESFIKCANNPKLAMQAYWNKWTNFADPNDYIVTEHEFIDQLLTPSK